MLVACNRSVGLITSRASVITVLMLVGSCLTMLPINILAFSSCQHITRRETINARERIRQSVYIYQTTTTFARRVSATNNEVPEKTEKGGIMNSTNADDNVFIHSVGISPKTTTVFTPPEIVQRSENYQTKDETVQMCRSLFSRFARGQELLRRNHGTPVLHQQDVLEQFIHYLNLHCRLPAEVMEMLQHMRHGSLMNTSGGTSGGRLQITQACMNKEPAFVNSVCESFFGRSGDNINFEIFPSTTKSIEALVSLLANEAETRERPIKVLIPSDAHYCWNNVAIKYESHPYLQMFQVQMGCSREDIGSLVRMREGDFVLAVFTLAATVSGYSTTVDWFENTLMQYVKIRTGSDPEIFIDAALSGCIISRQILDLRVDAANDETCEDYGSAVHRILQSAMGLVQSGFKDYGLSSMIFLDDSMLETCSCIGQQNEEGLASQVAGGSHPLIKHAPVTSIPESPTLAFLLFAREYTDFRRHSYISFLKMLQNLCIIPANVEYRLIPLFPLLKVKFLGDDSENIVKELTKALVETYSLISIDTEPDVLRLWPTPTNHDIVYAIQQWFENEYIIHTGTRNGTEACGDS